MPRTLPRVASLLLILATPPLAALADNLVTNGDIETGAGDRAGGWSTHIGAGEHRFFISPNAHSGKRCLAIASPAPAWGRWYNTDTLVLEGGRYRFSAWMRTEGEGAAAEIWVLGPFDRQATYRQNIPQWTEYTCEFTAKETSRVGIYLQSRGSGSVYFDDISLQLVEAPKLTGSGAIPCDDGRPLAGIVIPDAGLPNGAYLALDARRVLKEMTGVTLPVTVSASAAGRDVPVARLGDAPAGRLYEGPRSLYIGCAPDAARYRAALAQVGKEGIVLDVTPNAVVCLGNTPRGVYYALQELYYRLGCRWYMPWDGGECLPHAASLAIRPAARPYVHTPSFALRGAKIVQVYHYPPDMKSRHLDTEPWIDWTARNHMNGLKASYPQTWSYGTGRGGEWAEISGHSLYSIVPPEKYFATHPEWYPLVGGKRTHVHSSGRAAEVCVSNPELPKVIAQYIIDYFDNEPNAERFAVCAEDEPDYWCECPQCKALDTDPTLDWSKNGVECMNLTDRWMTFINRIAEIVARKYPNKIIATFAYGSTREVPRKVMPRTNVQIELTWWDRCFKHTMTDPACEVNAKGMQRLRDWQRIAKSVSIYGYLDYRYPEIPGASLHSEADFLRTVHRLGGVRHISDEWDTTHTASPILLNLRARLLWDVDTDVDAFIHNFCRAVYGPAAEPVQSYFATLERAIATAPSKHVSFNDLDKYTPQVLAHGRVLLSRAAELAGDDKTLQGRIARLQVSLLYARACQLSLRTDKEPAAWREFLAVRDQIEALVKRHNIPLVLGAYSLIDWGYRPPAEALAGRRLMELPEQWSFRTDPQSVGEKERWFARQELADSKSIKVTSAWEGQGYPGYDGDGWYLLKLKLPRSAAAHQYLLFEGVDETYKLWINGEYVGESAGDPATIWDKPQAAEITGKFRPDAENTVVVRVHDIGYAGGIYRPVWLVEGR